MHLVIVDSETNVSTHVIINCQSSGGEKRKNLKLQGELVHAAALGEELIISRSLFILTTPTTYDIFVVKSDERYYYYSRSVVLKKASEWLMFDNCIINFENAVVALDSEDLTVTVNVRSSCRVFIEDVNGFEEICLDPVVKDGADFIKLRLDNS